MTDFMDQPQQEKAVVKRMKIGGLWQQTVKASGKKFLSGDWGPFTQVQIWPNNKRDGKNDPDFMLYLVEKQPKPKEENPKESVPFTHPRGPVSSFDPGLPTSHDSYDPNDVPF